MNWQSLLDEFEKIARAGALHKLAVNIGVNLGAQKVRQVAAAGTKLPAPKEYGATIRSVIGERPSLPAGMRQRAARAPQITPEF